MAQACVCGSGETLDACCGPLLAGVPAPTAERLMRSRYAAFVLENEAHLLHTWHETTRPQHVDFDPLLRWTGLEILRAENGGVDDTRGLVEFRASFAHAGEAGVVHEVSRFVRGATGWVYVRGRLVARPS